MSTASEAHLQVAGEELLDLKGVWSELSTIWTQIDQLRDQPWLSVQPRKLRQQLDSLLTQLKQLPARLRHYSAYDHVKRLLQGYAKVDSICGYLCRTNEYPSPLCWA